MRRESGRIVIVGSGFAGSLLALIARTLDLDVVLLERVRHPRFAIGESSTPLANRQLQRVATDFNLPWLGPFTKYGSWKTAHPEITCGLKRGFSFFRHREGRSFESSDHHDNELLVAANPDAPRGDTHWYRSEFDAFLVDRAVESGVCYIDGCKISHLERECAWRIRATTEAGSLEISADFFVDATGDGNVLARSIGLSPDLTNVRTNTRALFSHFEEVRPWSDILDEHDASRREHPFPCDAAALHHLLDGAWMWVLRFDNGITSAGLSLNVAHHPRRPSLAPEGEWQQWLERYPSVKRQFDGARAIRPITATDRLQRRLSVAAGSDWAALPHAAAFVDPWLSSGIAHTLYSVRRLASVFAAIKAAKDPAPQLHDYSQRLLREAALADRITAACFGRFDCFPVLASLTMLYFAAVTYAEHQADDYDFLLADDRHFTAQVKEITDAAMCVDVAQAAAFQTDVARRLAPYNVAGLCDPARRNMYPFLSQADV